MMKNCFLAVFAVVALANDLPTPQDFIRGTHLPEESGWDSRIIGRSTASPGQFPYQASLRSAGNAHFCGGILANNRWIVSAAHCTVGRTTTNTIIVLGTHSRTTGGTRYNTAHIVNHPSYDANNIAFDVSVLQTTTNIGFDELVQPIALGSTFIGGGVHAVVSGWGVTGQPGGTAGANLQFFHVITMTNADCRNSVGGNGNLIFDHKICTQSLQDSGPCSLNSGGPLVAGNSAIGILSWGIVCRNGFADVYDRISSHRSWIVGHF